MSSPISDEWRLLARSRADHLCEYCLTHEDDCLFTLQIDHIISVKHGGAATLENLAVACIFCNRHKDSDVGAIMADGGLTRFFNPRTDSWAEHFRLVGGLIEPITAIGEGTARILRFNDLERVAEREELIAQGRYPTLQALARMSG
jgi:hypothetical protein